MSVYVSEPTKVKLASSEINDENEEEVKYDRVEYCPSTFTKQHAHKVAPPLPTFEVSLLICSMAPSLIYFILRIEYDVQRNSH